MTVCDPNRGIVHGYIAAVGDTYFTGSAWSAILDDARVYSRAADAKGAACRWNNHHPIPDTWWATRRALPVSLKLEGPML